jgi:hypothetical protein
VVEHGVVYLQRYHHQEVQVVADLHARAAQVAPPVDGDLLDRGLARVFPGAGFAEQRAAANSSVHAWTSIITGGPGDREDDHRRRRVGSARRAGGRRGVSAPSTSGWPRRPARPRRASGEPWPKPCPASSAAPPRTRPVP